MLRAAQNCLSRRNKQYQINHVLGLTHIRSGVIALLCLCAIPGANSHRQPISWGDVELSSDQHKAQITHRLHYHDAIAWLRHQGELQPNLDDLQQRALISLYAADNTRLWQQDERPVPVRVIGAESEDNYVFIYLESAEASLPITHLQTSLFMALNSAQRNRINVTTEAIRESFEFFVQTPPQRITKQ